MNYLLKKLKYSSILPGLIFTFFPISLEYKPNKGVPMLKFFSGLIVGFISIVFFFQNNEVGRVKFFLSILIFLSYLLLITSISHMKNPHKTK